MRFILIIVIILSFSKTFAQNWTKVYNDKFAQCSSLFSFAAYFETVNFSNQSTTSNAHYFWNFGDGTGSNFQNPIHIFPETGSYLVTLFSKDTVNNCSSFYEYWVNVTKYSTDVCQPSVTDSIYVSSGTHYLKIVNTSNNCNGYISTYDGGSALNFPWAWSINLSGWSTIPYRMVCRGQFYDIGNNLKREAYKSFAYNYSSSKNYGNCSANFEFITVSKDLTGQRILFKAMNKTSDTYEWNISGFGNPITSGNDTISQFYPYDSNDLWTVGLKITKNNCYDTLYQNILVRDIQTIESISEIKSDLNSIIYPNPALSTLNITDEQNKFKNSIIEIKNTLGQTVLSFPFKPEIDVSALSTGIYFLQIEMEDKRLWNAKFIKN